MRAVSQSGLSPAQLETLKRTVARDLNDVEFDQFMELCRSYNLDPFRRQIIAVIHYRDDPDKRTMTPIVTRDGLRVIASRQGDYRPQEQEAQFELHPQDWKHPGKGLPPNPAGIISASVTLFKLYADGWHPVVGKAYWDEYAPRGTAFTNSQWEKMPRVMIEKCADVAALRRGWPDAFGGLYIAEEFDHAKNDGMSASELIADARTKRRQKMVGHGILFDLDGEKLKNIPIGELHDRIEEALRSMSDQQVFDFRERNEEGLRQFWAAKPSDALAIKALMDPCIERHERETSTSANEGKTDD